MKRKYLFYYEEAVSAWIPAPEFVHNMVSVDDDEEFTIKFKVMEMTQKEFDDLPEA